MQNEVALGARPNRSTAIAAWAAVIAWMGVIFYMSSRTGIKVFSWMTYVAHFSEYVILALLLCLALYVSTKLGGRTLLIVALAVASAYGVSDELHQVFVPTRQPDLMDWLTDTIGASVAVLLWAGVTGARARAKRPVNGGGA